MRTQQTIQDAVIRAVANVYGEVDTSGVLVVPSDEFGDYASNAALVLAQRVGEGPSDIAAKIVSQLEGEIIGGVEKIDIAGPGFINFYLLDEFFIEEVNSINTQGHGLGKNDSMSDSEVLIEYTDPNPFKVFHIGHLMPNVIGEALSRLFEFSGAKVKRANYQGDVGLHVAKTLYGIVQMKDDFPSDDTPLTKRVAYLGDAYVKGAHEYDEIKGPTAIAEIKRINKAVYEGFKDEPELKEFYDKGRAWSLKHFEELYGILGTKFDHYFFESETFRSGKKIVLEHIDDGVFEKSDGAVIFAGERYGLHDRVFLNSEGLPTYEAKELGLAFMKHELFPELDRSIVVTGSEQSEYFKVVIKAVLQIDPEVSSKMVHIGHGMLRMTTGKMSSRKGNVVTGESLLNETIERAREKMSRDYIDELEQEAIAEAVGVAAIKFSILRSNTGKDIVFDQEKALSFEGDSGPYVQYTFARTQSLLRKADEKGLRATTEGYSGAVIDVEKLLHRFSMVIRRASEEKAPHLVCTYLLELSSAFNSYYANTPILDSEDVSYRLALTQAVGQVLRSGLYVLGMTAPERM